jgi:hypothetical protein
VPSGAWALLAFGSEEFEFVEGTGPVFVEETGEHAVGEELAAGLAHRAVIRFVGGVTDALDFCGAARAGLFVAAMNGHAFAEGGDFFGEFAGGFGAEAISPVRETRADGFEEALDFRDGKFLRERERREFGFPENFIGVGVADTAEEARIGEGALESVIGGEEDGGELLGSGSEDFEATGIERAEAVFARDNVKRGALLGTGFGPEKGAVGEVESRETARRGNFGAGWVWEERGLEGTPVKAAGNHEMKDEPKAVFEADANAFSEAAEMKNVFGFGVGERRSCSA